MNSKPFKLLGLALLIAALIAADFIFTVVLGSTAAKAAVPVCQTVLLQENSGNGPNYPVRVCNDRAVFTSPGVGRQWVLIVDGGPLPEHSTRTATIVIAETK